MIVDANVLLYAEDRSSPHHDPAVRWLSEALNGPVRIGLPWPSLLAFARIRTHPRAYDRPLTGPQAWA
ncbi:MAG: VapC toxin family PIN domain ribonuclease, partial [Actinomycetota bacterium]|nr:VapC toxin family PIN domain ribonuclease [Actinomycetota bacterium]